LNIELRTLKKATVPLTPALSPSDAERETTAARLLGNLVVMALVCISAGCVTKSKAKAEARAAFMAGQQQAMMQMAQPHPAVVTFIGPVRNPTVPWSQGLTLAKAIVDAGYQAPSDPQHIMIVRNGQAIPVDPKQLLQGEDIPLVAGDLVQIGQ
jgi:hypothetical protein